MKEELASNYGQKQADLEGQQGSWFLISHFLFNVLRYSTEFCDLIFYI